MCVLVRSLFAFALCAAATLTSPLLPTWVVLSANVQRRSGIVHVARVLIVFALRLVSASPKLANILLNLKRFVRDLTSRVS